MVVVRDQEAMVVQVSLLILSASNCSILLVFLAS